MQNLLIKLENECKKRTVDKDQPILSSLYKLCENNFKIEIIQTQINYNKLNLKSKLIDISNLCYEVYAKEKLKENKILDQELMSKLQIISDYILNLYTNSSPIGSEIFALTDNCSVQYNVADILLAIKKHQDSKWVHDFFNVSILNYLKQDEIIFQKFLSDKDKVLFLNCLNLMEDITNILKKHLKSINEDTALNLQSKVNSFHDKGVMLFPKIDIAPPEKKEKQFPLISSESLISQFPHLPQQSASQRSTVGPQCRAKSMVPKPSTTSHWSLKPRLTSHKPKFVMKHRIQPALGIDPITHNEFKSLPAYMKGRFLIDDLNTFVLSLSTTFRSKYQLIETGFKPGGFAQMKKESQDLFLEYKEDLDSFSHCIEKYFIKEEDLFRFSGCKLDKRGLNYMTMLRHLKKIREERLKRKIFYILMPH